MRAAPVSEDSPDALHPPSAQRASGAAGLLAGCSGVLSPWGALPPAQMNPCLGLPLGQCGSYISLGQG